MADEVERMFYTGDMPWHGKGEGIDKAKTDPIFMSDVHTEPLYRAVEGLPEAVEAQCVIRNIDGKIMSHHVGPEWTPYQARNAVAYFQGWEDQGLVTLETAGNLRGGSIQWILARISKEPMVIGGDDIVRKYVLLTWGHGAMAVRNGFTPIRVVCMNTLSASVADADSALIRVSHTKNVVQNVENLREVMNLANQQFEATAEQYRYLASKEINTFDLHRYVKIITEAKVDLETGATKDTPTSKKIIELFETGKGMDLKTAHGTWWGAYNAVSEYLTWGRGKDTSSRLENVWLGSGKALNKRALETAVRMAA